MLAPLAARADWTEFLPRTLETHAWIDLYGNYESYDQSAGTRRLKWSDLFLKEKLSLETAGYVYHPRFILYRAVVSGALKQENFEQSNLTPSGTQNGHAFEYDARLFLLPEHPYNLELFATRYEPLYRQEFVTPGQDVATSFGADFRYRKKPWSIHARASEDTYDSASLTTTVRRLNFDGRYTKEFRNGQIVSFDATYTPIRLTNTAGYASTSDAATLSNTLDLKRVRLFSAVGLDDLSQGGGETTIPGTSRLFSWSELLTADLPYNLWTSLTWRYQDNQTSYGGGAVAEATSQSNIHKSGEFDLRHQLYQSLQSMYIFRWDSSASGGGESNAYLNTLTFSYSKQVDSGRGRLLLGLSLGEGQTKNTGQVQVLEELHPDVSVPGAFLVQQAGGDPASVVLLVRSPAPPFELIRLVDGLNYSVAVVGNLLEITVVSLPAEFPVPGKYDFRVSYSLTSGDYTARMRTFGTSGSLALFDNLLTPYYGYFVAKSDVVSGMYPGGGLDSAVLTAGLRYFKGPVRANVEYGSVSWATNPWHGWKGDVQYVGPVGPSTSINTQLLYQVRYFEETQGVSALPAYTETVLSAFGSVQQFLLARSLSISAGGSYSKVTGLSDSQSWAANANVTWKIGKLDLSGGATYSHAETRGSSFYSTRNVHQYYYFRLRRYFF